VPDSKFRVGGGYTAFVYAGRPILYLEIVADTAPRAVAEPEPIHPLDSPHPIEVAFPKAHGMGTLTLTIREQWVADIWQQLPGFEAATDILQVFEANIRNGNVTCTKIVQMPDGGKRATYYHNTVITGIDDGETVNVRSMTFPKVITMQYTHKTRTAASGGTR
jgi:hypothetical protein